MRKKKKRLEGIFFVNIIFIEGNSIGHSTSIEKPIFPPLQLDLMKSPKVN